MALKAVETISQTGNRIKQGFTFLELTFVVLIIAVLTGLSVPMLRNAFSNMQLLQSSSNLADVLNYARQAAILDRCEYRLRLDVSEKSFWIEQNGSKSGKVYSLPKGIEIYSKMDQIGFYPNGKSDDAEIIIKNKAKIFIFTLSNTARFIKIEKTIPR
jgi:prepilin-type N-terminal cleavage/methylation domain-containing protein